MANKPTTVEALNLVSEHFGISASEAREIMRGPLHPKTLRDEIAMSFVSGILSESLGQVETESRVRRSYDLADVMLAARLK